MVEISNGNPIYLLRKRLNDFHILFHFFFSNFDVIFSISLAHLRKFLIRLHQIDHHHLLQCSTLPHDTLLEQRVQQIYQIYSLVLIDSDLMGNVMLEGLFLLLMSCNQLIAFGNDCAFLPEDGFFYAVILLLGHISQLLQLPPSLLNAEHSSLLHLLQLVYFFIDFCEILLQSPPDLLSLLLNGIGVMVFMTTIDEAFRTDEGIIASLADIHDGVFRMPITSPLKVTIKTFINFISLLSEKTLAVKDILLFFCDHRIGPHQFHQLFVKPFINLSDLLAPMTGNSIAFSLFLSANFIKCTKQANTMGAAENHDVFWYCQAGTAFFFITHITLIVSPLPIIKCCCPSQPKRRPSSPKSDSLKD